MIENQMIKFSNCLRIFDRMKGVEFQMIENVEGIWSNGFDHLFQFCSNDWMRKNERNVFFSNEVKQDKNLI